MKHAIIKNGSPEYYSGKFAVDSEGTQHPLRNMSKAQKLEYGIQEVEYDLAIPEGHVPNGRELVLLDGIITERALSKPRSYATAAEAKAAMVQWIDRMTAKVLSRYPQSVRVRWPEEEAAARAVKGGTATPEQTTLITDEGAAKGRTPVEHADIIIGHADNFRAISGEVNKLFLSVDAALDAETDPAQYEVILEDAKAQAETLAAAYGLV